jgi:Na+/proline symporter/signal transduction histidine kinase
MLSNGLILAAAFGYLFLLFAIAWYGDRRADRGRSLIANPYIYALSIAVYCTAWTFYGSVGRAASDGIEFLPIYLGPTLVFLLGAFVLRKIVRISRENRITSIADFISSRYGKSQLLGGVVTVIAVVGIVPYISLQLKAVSTSFNVLLNYPEIVMPRAVSTIPVFQDTALYVAGILALFSILFGTRHIDLSEHHEGMVAAIAFESIVKLVAFLAAGLFVVFGLFGGLGDIFARAAASPELAKLFEWNPSHAGGWLTLMVLSMAAILCLPRQWQMTVVENVDEKHLTKAIWLFPLYLVLINLFVLPIAVGGLLTFQGKPVDSDTFVLALPMHGKQELMAVVVFLGGLSAATGMVIVETVALSTMVCNDLVMPILLRWKWLKLAQRRDLTRLLLTIRRISIGAILVLSYLYFKLIGESYTLVTIGLVSFAAVAQFAPVIIGGLFWKGATRPGALAGLGLGFVVWFYTLLLPSFVKSGWLPRALLEEGPFGIALLRPEALFGLTGWDNLSHALFWSLLVNIGAYVAVSMWTNASAIERVQASRFVDVFKSAGAAGLRYWRGTATVTDLIELLGRFIGRGRAERAFEDYAKARDLALAKLRTADSDLVHFAERLLAGAIGAASARVMIASVSKGQFATIEEVMEIVDEASQIIQYSRKLEQKSIELNATMGQLRAANERLKELDRLKDDFLSTVSHELRTPLTSIRAFGEILRDNPALPPDERGQYLGIVIKESERLTRLINQILDLAKMDAGRMEWQIEKLDLKSVLQDALAATKGLVAERPIRLDVRIPDGMPRIHADRDKLIQVAVNLISNAVKFCDRADGWIGVLAVPEQAGIRVDVRDNGPGVRPADRERIFERFHQGADTEQGRPQGTGLGLAICRQIVERFGGRIWVEQRPGGGSVFSFFLPYELPARARPPRLVEARAA